MHPNSAHSLVSIEAKIDYTLNSLAPIFAIHCTKTNTDTVKIISYDNNETVFPPHSFIQGAIYWIYIKSITDLGGGSFIGYKYQERPFQL